MSARVVDAIPEFLRGNGKVMDLALARMAQDVKILASARAPYKSGELTRSATDEPVGKHKFRVVFDMPYAGYQERGSRIDGSRPVRRYTTPATGSHYLADAGRSIAAKATNYFIQAAQSARI